jgi:hypothetical protein
MPWKPASPMARTKGLRSGCDAVSLMFIFLTGWRFAPRNAVAASG